MEFNVVYLTDHNREERKKATITGTSLDRVARAIAEELSASATYTRALVFDSTSRYLVRQIPDLTTPLPSPKPKTINPSNRLLAGLIVASLTWVFAVVMVLLSSNPWLNVLLILLGLGAGMVGIDCYNRYFSETGFVWEPIKKRTGGHFKHSEQS